MEIGLVSKDLLYCLRKFNSTKLLKWLKEMKDDKESWILSVYLCRI